MSLGSSVEKVKKSTLSKVRNLGVEVKVSHKRNVNVLIFRVTLLKGSCFLVKQISLCPKFIDCELSIFGESTKVDSERERGGGWGWVGVGVGVRVSSNIGIYKNF